MARKLPFLLFLSCLLPLLSAYAQTGIDVPSMRKADSLIRNFLQSYSIPGATVAITKDGRLIYNRGFGMADQARTEPMHPWHLQRIASNSKAITGIAIMKLVENGVLGLNDTVFGPGRILSNPYYLGAITDSRIYNITVRQLLEHTAGWDRNIACDGFSHCDPIGFPLHVTSKMGEGNPVGDSTLIRFLISKGLNHAPGTTYAYSNIAYLVLAKVIEQKTGLKYGDYVRNAILLPQGIHDIQLGRNLLRDKAEREAEYHSAFTTKSCYGTGATVPWQYGGWNLEAMHAHGGWISSSEDYVRMILGVDGFPEVPDILNASSITAMVTPSSANANYAKGWSVNAAGNWWHTGSLDGTSSMMARTSGGYTWAIHLNSRSSASGFWNDLDDLAWNCIAGMTSEPTHDLFAPRTQASRLTATKTGISSVQLSWTAGSGDMRTVIATEMDSWKFFPQAGVAYTGDPVFRLGPPLGHETFVVYNGTGTGVTVTGLDPGKTYRFAVLEGYNNAATGRLPVYKYGGRTDAVINMATTAVPGASAPAASIAFHPNPAESIITLHTTDRKLHRTEAVITDIQGRTVQHVSIKKEVEHIDIRNLSQGMYFLRLENGNALKLHKL